MGDRYRTSDGWAVEVVGLSATPDRNDGERLKVTYCGFFVESSGIAVDGRGRQVAAGVALIVRLLVNRSPLSCLARPCPA
jgi:hypothetical protein